jgi:Niemann-Pick C1 protein
LSLWLWDQEPRCANGDAFCAKNTTYNECTTCLFQEDLLQGRLSASQFHDKLPWFLEASPTSDCAKGGHSSYQTSLNLAGYDSGVIQASKFHSFHTSLNTPSEFTEALRSVRDFTSKVSARLNITVFPYSPFYIFFDQYLGILSTAVFCIFLSLGTVFGVSLLVSSSVWVAIINLVVIAAIVLNLMGLMVMSNIRLNAISITNLLIAIGISVEFCAHITHAFTMRTGRRSERTSKALIAIGPSIFSGMTLTNFLGIAVLFFSQSRLIQVYYFRMYLGLVILGALYGLVFLPVLLTLAGPRSLAFFSYTVDGKPVYYKNQDHDHHFNPITINDTVSSEPPTTDGTC